MTRMTPQAQRAPRRSTALSKAVVVAAAIEILDAEGEDALTFRALARRLSTGSGALYHHVANKGELLRAATEKVVGDATREAIGNEMADATADEADAADAIRDLMLGIFDAIETHPWVGAQMAREPWGAPLLGLFEAIAGRLETLGVPARTQFDAASVLVHYVIGLAAQSAAAARALANGAERSTLLDGKVMEWAGADDSSARRISDYLAEHDNREQLRACVDLVLAGLI